MITASILFFVSIVFAVVGVVVCGFISEHASSDKVASRWDWASVFCFVYAWFGVVLLFIGLCVRVVVNTIVGVNS